MKKQFLILITFFVQTSYACVCSKEPVNIDDIYRKSSGIYMAVVSKVEALNISSGRADVDIELTVLRAFKGKKVQKINTTEKSSFPTMADGGFEKKETSCDSVYFVGQEFLVAIYNAEPIRLSVCSPNVLPNSQENLSKLAKMAGL